MRRLTSLCVLLVPLAFVFADGPADNIPKDVRPIPPKGIKIPDADLAALKSGLTDFRKQLDDAATTLKSKPELLELLPDVEIYHKAVRYAVEYDEFYKLAEVATAKALLEAGKKRLAELLEGKPSWTTATGLVVRGYKSKIDGSVQPYGLVIPKEYDAKKPARLDFWWHGRGETLTELDFINGRQKSAGEFTPAGAIVVHPYGRYCNANKFAGEIDSLEILDHVKKNYAIDSSKIVARGFSMGGAACWQYAVHYPTLWAVAAPGAGFSETPEFLDVFQNEKVSPPWYEKKLWRMYNATDYAQNIFNLPTVAYSGADDKQKQAADVMAREMKKLGLELTHIIGPKTGHSYEKEAKKIVNEKVDEAVKEIRPVIAPEIRFVTYTLRYNRCGWLVIDGLEKHWERGFVHGSYKEDTFTLTTQGVSELTVEIPAGPDENVSFQIVLDAGAAEKVTPPAGKVGHLAMSVSFRKVGLRWVKIEKAPAEGLAKVHGLQGPIDDAFMDSFIMVKPTGKPMNEMTGKWVETEMKHAIQHWRKQFRGDAIIKNDVDITEADIKANNLILWGDSKSNAFLAKIADKLPAKWVSVEVIEGMKRRTESRLEFGGQGFDITKHVPVMIYPNPLNPKKYVVLNSGFTFREYDYLNNARQVSKLPDYAVIDVTTPPNSRYPGKVVRAGFFDEKWQLQKNDGE